MIPRTALAVILALAAATGCGAADAGGEVVVFAAASLTEVVDGVGADLDGELDVTANVAGSQILAAQILTGAPADVFLSADEAQMQRVADAGHVLHGPVVVARNRLVIAVPAGNPAGIATVADLARPELTVVLPAPEVPAGAYAADALAQAGVTLRPASLEPDVRAALRRVALGDADAALVYATDVATTDRVDGVELAPDVTAATTVLAAVLDGPRPAAGRRLLDHLRAPAGRARLQAAGFDLPAGTP